MSVIPLSVLGAVFVVWLLGVAVVLAVLRGVEPPEDHRDGDVDGYGNQDPR